MQFSTFEPSQFTFEPAATHPKFASPPHDEISLHHSLHGHGHDWIHHSRQSPLVDHEFHLLPDHLGKVAHL
jgi:hypothetical protein